MELPELHLKLSDLNLWISVATIMFNPLFWNTIARMEHRTHFITRSVGSRERGCILLGLAILALGAFRDWRFKLACDNQPQWPLLYNNYALYSGYLLMLMGSVFVFSSYWSLGFYGTFLGDYFGILMDSKVTGFPFNILENPMYWGSTMIFLGTALVEASQTGVFLSCLIAVCYKIAIGFEGPFTSYIYSQRSRKSV